MKKFLIIIFSLFIISSAGFAEKLPVVSRISHNTAAHTKLNDFTIYSIISILTLINFLIWHKYGKDDIVIPVVNFYPPNNLNPAEAELAYKGKVSLKGISGLVIYLASKGFIEIKEEKDSYIIERKEDSPLGLSYEEKKIMNALFPFGEDLMTKEDLQRSYILYDTSNKIMKNLNRKKELLFFKETINNSLLILMLVHMFVLIILSIFYQGINFYNLICIIISGVCTYQLPKRTGLGNKLLGKLLGLKRFIEVAKKNEIEMFVEKNPNYFYEILPYAYVLDVSDKWISKFEDISVIDPDFHRENKFYSSSNLMFINAILDKLNEVYYKP
ncbi:DUF2207 domain-containing protein [bacterium]|nr:DUF2207 domain-containing protein [bacterium]